MKSTGSGQQDLGYFMEDTGDELNDETFGDLDEESIARTDFDFVSNAQSLTPIRHQPDKASPRPIPSAFGEQQQQQPGSLPASPIPHSTGTARTVLSAADLERQIMGGTGRKKVVLNLDELESTFHSSLSFDAKKQAATSPESQQLERVTSPPGLSASRAAPPGTHRLPPQLLNQPSKPAVQISFPKHDENDLEDGSPRSVDPNRHLMTKYEREGIRRIHMAQLTTDKPGIEDHYYQAYSKRSLKNRNQANTPLYLPLPNLKRRQASPKEAEELKDRPNPFEGALGKISRASARKPRQQLQVEATSPSLMPKLEDLSAEELHFSVLGSIERLYTACFSVEDVVDQGTEEEAGPQDAKAVEQAYKEASLKISRILMLTDDKEWGRDQIFKFVNILASVKGRRAVFRSVKYMQSDVIGKFLRLLVQNLEYLFVFRPNTTQQEIDSFVNLVLSPLVPFVSDSSSTLIVGLIRDLVEKKSFLWLALNRPGLILLCILMSRIEICKSNVVQGSEDDVLFATEWAALAKHLYELLADRLNDFFHLTGGPKPSGKQAVVDGGDFYVWQFLALLALNVDSDARRFMIVELRDRIMMTVQIANPKDLTNLNIFLNVLGLDASQLTGQ